MTLTLRYSIVNIKIFRLEGITGRSHMIGKYFSHVNLDLEPRTESQTCSRYYQTHKCVKIYHNPLINAGARMMTASFYAPNFKEVGGAYCFWVVRPSVLPSFRPSVRPFVTLLMHSITLKP